MRTIRTLFLVSVVAALGVFTLGAPAGADEAPADSPVPAAEDLVAPDAFELDPNVELPDDLVAPTDPGDEGEDDDDGLPEIEPSDGTEVKDVPPAADPEDGEDEEECIDDLAAAPEDAEGPIPLHPVCPEDEPEDPCEAGYYYDPVSQTWIWVGPTEQPEDCEEPEDTPEDCEEPEYTPEGLPEDEPEDCDEPEYTPEDEPDEPGGRLPFTGGVTVPLLIGGLAIGGTGVGLWLASRRRSIV